jgi:phage shock protein PspC (stress-responsive transcriptional regulator)
MNIIQQSKHLYQIKNKFMRKFYRSTKNKYVSGICGGLGYHTKVDPILWRMFMVMLGPTAIIPYLILTLLTDKK